MTKKAFWKWLLIFIAGCFLFLISYAVISIPTSFDAMMPLWALALACVATSALNLLLYALWWKWTEKEKAKDLPMDRLASNTGVGFGIGILYFIIVTGVIALLGGYKIGGIGNDWTALAKSLFTFLVVAVGEEVLFRGIVFRLLDQQWGTVVALILSALLFGFVHITNDNATVWSSVAIAVEAGLLLGAAYKWAGNLWLPIGIHWAWNFFQGPIFGFAVSGNDTSSLIKPVIEGSEWLTGGTFGAEASIPAFVTGLIFTALFLYWNWKRNYRER